MGPRTGPQPKELRTLDEHRGPGREAIPSQWNSRVHKVMLIGAEAKRSRSVSADGAVLQATVGDVRQ